ncbi:MAG: NIPSNAP family protein [Alphaproteobacteria bacterium]|nr:NIPSNAP family protein [Alphaproteobacteria bacterium]
MIVDERTYTLYPGKVAELFKLYEAEGMPVQTRILGRMIGFFQTEIGTLNQIVHLWAYDSFEERQRRRTALFQDQQWLAYMAKARPLLMKMENRILVPAPFSPIR